MKSETGIELKVIKKTSKSNIATVYIAKAGNKKMVEFVESLQPPLTINQKWILMVSLLFGCPVKCMFCDAGSDYKGKLTHEQIMFQIDYLIKKQLVIIINKNIIVQNVMVMERKTVKSLHVRIVMEVAIV